MNDVLVGAALGLMLTLGARAAVRHIVPSWRIAPPRLVALAVFFGALFTGVSHVYGPGFAALCAALGGLASLPALALRTRKARAIERALAALGDEHTRAEICRTLDRLIGPAPDRASRAYRRWARVALHVAGGAARAGAAREALAWAERVDVTGLEPTLVAGQALSVAAASMALNDYERARRALAGVPRPSTDPLAERALSAREALLDALGGDAESAEARASAGLAAEPEPALRSVWQAARAHALAALGRRDEAIDALRALARSAAGEPVLARLVRQAGAASPLAQSLLDEGRDGVPSKRG